MAARLGIDPIRSPFETEEYMKIVEEVDAEQAQEAVSKMQEVSKKVEAKKREEPDWEPSDDPYLNGTTVYEFHCKNVFQQSSEKLKERRSRLIAKPTNEDVAGLVASFENPMESNLIPHEALEIVYATAAEVQNIARSYRGMITRRLESEKKRQERMKRHDLVERALQFVAGKISEAVCLGQKQVQIDFAEHHVSLGDDVVRAELRRDVLEKLRGAGYRVAPIRAIPRNENRFAVNLGPEEVEQGGPRVDPPRRVLGEHWGPPRDEQRYQRQRQELQIALNQAALALDRTHQGQMQDYIRQMEREQR